MPDHVPFFHRERFHVSELTFSFSSPFSNFTSLESLPIIELLVLGVIIAIIVLLLLGVVGIRKMLGTVVGGEAQKKDGRRLRWIGSTLFLFLLFFFFALLFCSMNYPHLHRHELLFPLPTHNTPHPQHHHPHHHHNCGTERTKESEGKNRLGRNDPPAGVVLKTGKAEGGGRGVRRVVTGVTPVEENPQQTLFLRERRQEEKRAEERMNREEVVVGIQAETSFPSPPLLSSSSFSFDSISFCKVHLDYIVEEEEEEKKNNNNHSSNTNTPLDHTNEEEEKGVLGENHHHHPYSDTDGSSEVEDKALLERLTCGVLFLVMLIFLGGTVFLTVEQRIPLPHTVVLFLYGILMGRLTLWVYPDVGLTLGNIPPDLLFFIFLPVLIFEGSYSINVYAFRRVLWHIIVLATIGIVVNTALLSVAIKGFYRDWTWFSAALLGSLLSATDPVAVLSLLKQLRVDKFLTATIDGEAVMNDGTAIIIFMILLPATLAGEFTQGAWMIVLSIGRLLLLPMILGPAFGFVQLFWLRRTHDPLTKACVTVSVSYVSYYIVYYYFDSSAVLTLCLEGVFLSFYYPSLFPGQEVNFVSDTWAFLVHLCNTVLFSLLGVILVADVWPTLQWEDMAIILALYVVLMAARLVMLEMLVPMSNLFSDRVLTQKEILLLAHGGLRGGVAVTLALAVNQKDPLQGVTMLKLTSGVVLLTLLINATTASYVVKRLGFHVRPLHSHMEMQYGMQFLLDTKRRALEEVKRDTKYKNTDWHAVETYLTSFLRNPFRRVGEVEEDETTALNRLTMSAFKACLWRQRDELVISETVIQELSQLVNQLIDRGELLDMRHLALYHHRRRHRRRHGRHPPAPPPRPPHLPSLKGSSPPSLPPPSIHPRRKAAQTVEKTCEERDDAEKIHPPPQHCFWQEGRGRGVGGGGGGAGGAGVDRTPAPASSSLLFPPPPDGPRGQTNVLPSTLKEEEEKEGTSIYQGENDGRPHPHLPQDHDHLVPQEEEGQRPQEEPPKQKQKKKKKENWNKNGGAILVEEIPNDQKGSFFRSVSSSRTSSSPAASFPPPVRQASTRVSSPVIVPISSTEENPDEGNVVAVGSSGGGGGERGRQRGRESSLPGAPFSSRLAYPSPLPTPPRGGGGGEAQREEGQLLKEDVRENDDGNIDNDADDNASSFSSSCRSSPLSSLNPTTRMKREKTKSITARGFSSSADSSSCCSSSSLPFLSFFAVGAPAAVTPSAGSGGGPHPPSPPFVSKSRRSLLESFSMLLPSFSKGKENGKHHHHHHHHHHRHPHHYYYPEGEEDEKKNKWKRDSSKKKSKKGPVPLPSSPQKRRHPAVMEAIGEEEDEQREINDEEEEEELVLKVIVESGDGEEEEDEEDDDDGDDEEEEEEERRRRRSISFPLSTHATSSTLFSSHPHRGSAAASPPTAGTATTTTTTTTTSNRNKSQVRLPPHHSPPPLLAPLPQPLLLHPDARAISSRSGSSSTGDGGSDVSAPLPHLSRVGYPTGAAGGGGGMAVYHPLFSLISPSSPHAPTFPRNRSDRHNGEGGGKGKRREAGHSEKGKGSDEHEKHGCYPHYYMEDHREGKDDDDDDDGNAWERQGEQQRGRRGGGEEKNTRTSEKSGRHLHHVSQQDEYPDPSHRLLSSSSSLDAAAAGRGRRRRNSKSGDSKSWPKGLLPLLPSILSSGKSNGRRRGGKADHEETSSGSPRSSTEAPIPHHDGDKGMNTSSRSSSRSSSYCSCSSYSCSSGDSRDTEAEEEDTADETVNAVMTRLLPFWVVWIERLIEAATARGGRRRRQVFFTNIHRRAQENGFMTILAIVKCLTSLSEMKYQYVSTPSQARRLHEWLQKQLSLANVCINFFYRHFREATTAVSSARAVLSVTHSLEAAVETLHLFHGFGQKLTARLDALVLDIRDHLPTALTPSLYTSQGGGYPLGNYPSGRGGGRDSSSTTSTPTTTTAAPIPCTPTPTTLTAFSQLQENDLVMRAVASTTLGRGLRHREMNAITSMGLVQNFKHGDVIVLPKNSFLVIVFGSIHILRRSWMTAAALEEQHAVKSFGDTVGLDTFLLPEGWRKNSLSRRRWKVLTEECKTLLISFQSVQPFLMERSLRAVKALWRAAAVEVVLPLLEEMITLPGVPLGGGRGVGGGVAGRFYGGDGGGGMAGGRRRRARFSWTSAGITGWRCGASGYSGDFSGGGGGQYYYGGGGGGTGGGSGVGYGRGGIYGGEREHLTGMVMGGTPLIGPHDCNRFQWSSPFHICFYLRGSDSLQFFTADTPPCHVSTFYLDQVVWTSPDVVLYVVPVSISDGGYVPWGRAWSSLHPKRTKKPPPPPPPAPYPHPYPHKRKEDEQEEEMERRGGVGDKDEDTGSSKRMIGGGGGERETSVGEALERKKKKKKEVSGRDGCRTPCSSSSSAGGDMGGRRSAKSSPSSSRESSTSSKEVEKDKKRRKSQEEEEEVDYHHFLTALQGSYFHGSHTSSFLNYPSPTLSKKKRGGGECRDQSRRHGAGGRGRGGEEARAGEAMAEAAAVAASDGATFATAMEVLNHILLGVVPTPSEEDGGGRRRRQRRKRTSGEEEETSTRRKRRRRRRGRNGKREKFPSTTPLSSPSSSTSTSTRSTSPSSSSSAAAAADASHCRHRHRHRPPPPPLWSGAWVEHSSSSLSAFPFSFSSSTSPPPSGSYSKGREENKRRRENSTSTGGLRKSRDPRRRAFFSPNRWDYYPLPPPVSSSASLSSSSPSRSSPRGATAAHFSSPSGVETKAYNSASHPAHSSLSSPHHPTTTTAAAAAVTATATTRMKTTSSLVSTPAATAGGAAASSSSSAAPPPFGCCCVIQSFKDFVSPVPLLNHLFAEFASILEQLCIAALRYVLMPSDNFNIRHAQRIGGRTVDFLMEFVITLQVLQETVECCLCCTNREEEDGKEKEEDEKENKEEGPHATVPLPPLPSSQQESEEMNRKLLPPPQPPKQEQKPKRQGGDGGGGGGGTPLQLKGTREMGSFPENWKIKAVDSAFQIKVSQWASQRHRTGGYNLRHMVLGMRGYANHRFESLVASLRVVVEREPSLAKVESVEGLQKLLGSFYGYL